MVVEGISKNVHKGHLDEIFGVYGKIIQIDLPIFAVCEWSFRRRVRGQSFVCCGMFTVAHPQRG